MIVGDYFTESMLYYFLFCSMKKQNTILIPVCFVSDFMMTGINYNSAKYLVWFKDKIWSQVGILV